jgi:hypothetical protein
MHPRSTLIFGALAGLFIASVGGYACGRLVAARTPVQAQFAVYDMDDLLRKTQAGAPADQDKIMAEARARVQAMAAAGVIVLNPTAVRAAATDVVAK